MVGVENPYFTLYVMYTLFHGGIPGLNIHILLPYGAIFCPFIQAEGLFLSFGGVISHGYCTRNMPIGHPSLCIGPS